MPHRLSRRIRPAILVLTTGLVLCCAAVGLHRPPPSAGAAVTPRTGYRATVLGWSSWYGSYDMGMLGPAWCIDHGLHAPDPAFRYLPVRASDLDADRRAAMAWAVAERGGGDDPVDAAAVMLVLHDLRGASYPFGTLDVDRLRPAELAGFDGHEAEVIARARDLKADAWAHRHLRAPFHLSVELQPAAGLDGTVVAQVVDAAGTAVPGAGVALTAHGATVEAPTGGSTAADGRLARRYHLTEPNGGATFEAAALVADPELSTFSSSTVRAQRVAARGWLGLRARGVLAAPPPTTSTSTAPPPTTAPPTTAPPTTAPPTTAPPTTAPPTTTAAPTTSTSVPPATTAVPRTSASPPASSTVPVPSGPASSLPVTGAGNTWALTAIGLVLMAVGGVLALAGRARRNRPRHRPRRAGGLTMHDRADRFGVRAPR